MLKDNLEKVQHHMKQQATLFWKILWGGEYSVSSFPIILIIFCCIPQKQEVFSLILWAFSSSHWHWIHYLLFDISSSKIHLVFLCFLSKKEDWSTISCRTQPPLVNNDEQVLFEPFAILDHCVFKHDNYPKTQY